VKLRNSLISAACAVLLTSLDANAALIDAVSVVVDNEPITIYEIYRLSKQFDIQTREALDILIRQKLELSQIKTMNIQVSDYDINQQIGEIAAKNNLSIQAFYNALKNEGIPTDVYKAELKKKMQQDKLYQYVLSSKFQAANEDDLLSYYNENQKEFMRFDSFDVIKFESQDAKDLENIYKKPANNEEEFEQIADNYIELAMENSETIDEYNNISSSDLSNNSDVLEEQKNSLEDNFEIPNENVIISSQNIESLSSDPKIASMLSQTDINTFTPIIQTKDGFAIFFLEAKNNQTVLPFEQVKNFIMSKISSKQENEILKEYYDTLKSRATITIIRLP
jgi:parvulin-like peptidyl-prolyl isomerase